MKTYFLINSKDKSVLAISCDYETIKLIRNNWFDVGLVTYIEVYYDKLNFDEVFK